MFVVEVLLLLQVIARQRRLSHNIYRNTVTGLPGLLNPHNLSREFPAHGSNQMASPPFAQRTPTYITQSRIASSDTLVTPFSTFHVPIFSGMKRTWSSLRVQALRKVPSIVYQVRDKERYAESSAGFIAYHTKRLHAFRLIF